MVGDRVLDFGSDWVLVTGPAPPSILNLLLLAAVL